MTTSVKSSADRYDLNVTADVPDFALLFLPPFPLPDTAVAPPVSYGLWKQSGIFIVCQIQPQCAALMEAAQ